MLCVALLHCFHSAIEARCFKVVVTRNPQRLVSEHHRHLPHLWRLQGSTSPSPGYLANRTLPSTLSNQFACPPPHHHVKPLGGIPILSQDVRSFADLVPATWLLLAWIRSHLSKGARTRLKTGSGPSILPAKYPTTRGATFFPTSLKQALLRRPSSR